MAQLENLNEETRILNQTLLTLKSTLEGVLNISKQLDTEFQETGRDAQQVATGIGAVNQNAKTLELTEKELLRTQDQINKVSVKAAVERRKEGQDLAKIKILRQQQNQAIKNEILLKQGSTKEGKKLNETLRQQRKELRAMKGTSGGFLNSLKSMATGFLGVTALIYGFVRAVGNGIKISVGFEKQMDKVQAITGATASDMKLLSDNAKDLGGVTTKTASEVGQLQEEFAKLGFTTKEILAATEATISLSEAAGGELSQSAVVAASTLRGFGLAATETQRVVDVMAKSFASSGLDLNKFQTAMADVAPVAKASGVEIEQATALLGTLVDSGLDASKAGTSLRNIFLENAKSGRTLNQSLALIRNSSDSTAKAMELFGKRGAVAGLVLTDNQARAEELAVTLDNAGGSAKEMADIMRDNLAGDVTILKSAWEGFILSMEDGEGIFAKVSRKFIQGLTNMVIFMTGAKDKFVNAWNDISKSSNIFRTVIAVIGNAVRLNFQLMIGSAKLVAEAFLGVGKVIKAALTGDFKSIKGIVSDTFSNIGSRANDLKNNFVDAGKNIANAFKGDSIDKFLIKTGDVEDATISMNNKIKSFATDYEQAYEDATEAAKKHAAALKKIEEERKKAVGKEISDIEFLAEKGILENKKKLLNKEISEEQFAANMLQLQIDSLAQQLGITALNNEEKLKINQALVDAQLAQDKILTDEKLENEKLIQEAKKETQLLLIDSANALFDLGSTFRDRESAAIDEEEAKRLAAAEGNATEKARIEAEFDKKRKDLARKQAIQDKIQALFNAGINTGIGITKALASSPPPANFILAAAVGALGAIQIANIAAKPLPAFAKGVENFEGGLAKVGEKGAELALTPTGAFLTPDHATLMNLPAGTDIIPHDLTTQAMQGGISVDHLNELINEERLTRKAILKKPAIKQTLIDQNGMRKFHKANDSSTEWLNTYIRK